MILRFARPQLPTSRTWLAAALIALAPLAARADAVDALRQFTQKVQSARADFSQTVTSPDGAKKKTSSGSFEFQRPNRFRFDYTKPYEQLIVADGQKVWLYDADLNQVTVRGFDQALGNTPAAVLAGASIERDFSLTAQPAQADAPGLQWVLATPKAKDGAKDGSKGSAEPGAIRAMRLAFRGNDLAALEITDAFGQRSYLAFSKLEVNPSLSPQRFRFQPPAGAELLQQ